MVFLTDARDVIVQANPFDSLDEEKLHVFLQANEIYGDKNIDTAWIHRVLGAATADRLQGKRVSCCGTIIGGRRIVAKYLEQMTAAIIAHKVRVIDQAIHNKIVHLDFPSQSLVMHRNHEGAVLTLGGMSVNDVELTSETLRLHGRVIPVVHMYDPVKKINEFFCDLYRNNTGVER